MMKKNFFFTLKSLFDLKIFKYPNISRIQGNQTMKFGQLIEYDMGNTLALKQWNNNLAFILPSFQ